MPNLPLFGIHVKHFLYLDTINENFHPLPDFGRIF